MMTKLDPITERSVMKSTAVHALMIDYLKCLVKDLTFLKRKYYFLGSIGTVWFSSC